MNPFVTLLAAEHLQDLLREAEQERQLRILRCSAAEGRAAAVSHAAAMGHDFSKSRAVGRRIVSAIRRIRGALASNRRSRPAVT